MNPTNDIFQGLSVLLLSEDDARGKALAKALRDQRARVGEVSVSTREGGRGIDLAVVDARSELSCAAQLTALRADVRGRWASVVTIDYAQLVKGDGSVLLASLAERVAPLVEADRVLTERAREETSFKTTLSPLGPPRTLRALSLSGHTLFVELRTRTLDALIEVSNELLVSASATRGDKRWEAWSALVRILGLDECEITVSRRAFTSFMNIMEPVDQALEVAAQERQCSADQIAREEADAEARSTDSHKLPPKVPAALPPAPGQAPARPAPPARPAGTLGHQRTLMGVMPGLPAPGIAANDVRAFAPKPPEAPKPAEAPRYAHRTSAPAERSDARGPGLPGARAGKAASMTLMGVAPSAIPGLAALRAQRAEVETREQSRVSEPVADARAAQREALKNALNSTPNFDPPTVRHNLASIQDLTDELPDLLEDFSRSTQPLSSPLPTPQSERDDDEREQRPGMNFDDDDDSEERTIVASSALTEELLARALEGAATERPPAAEPKTVPASAGLEGRAQNREASAAREAERVETRASAAQQNSFERPSVAEHELEQVLPLGEPSTPQERPAKSSEPAPAADLSTDFTVGEETLVVHRKADRPRSRALLIGALLLLIGLLALLLYTALKPKAAESAPASQALAVKPATARPAPSAPVAPVAEKPPEPPPSNALVPLAEAPAANEVRAQNEAPVEKAPVNEAPTEAAPIEEAALAEAPGADAAVAAQGELKEPATDKPAAPAAATETSPSDQVEDLLKRGQRLLALRDAAGARPLLEQAVALQGDNPHARASLAEVLLKLNELPLALVQAQTAVKLRPKRSRYLVLQGDVLAAMGKPDQALTSFKRAFELDPNDIEAKRKAGL